MKIGDKVTLVSKLKGALIVEGRIIGSFKFIKDELAEQEFMYKDIVMIKDWIIHCSNGQMDSDDLTYGIIYDYECKEDATNCMILDINKFDTLEGLK